MAAAREQAEERRLDRVGREVERGDVPVQVVDRHEGQAARPGERLRRREADEQRPDEPRPPRHRDRLDVVQGRVRTIERLADDRRHELEVPPRGDLGDDAAEAGVQVGLGGDDERISPAAVTSAAAVSSHDVSIPSITPLRPARPRRGRAT